MKLFLISFLVFIHVQLRQYAFDDAYIHFRIARNLVEIGAPYYNTPDALKVSTSSGWIVFLAMIYWAAKIINMESNFPLLISLLNALISICDLIVYSKIMESLLKKQLTILQKLPLWITILALLLPSSIGLMETPLALLIAGLGIYFLLCSKPRGFALLGIAIYLRLELVVLVMLAGIIVVFQEKFRLYQILGYFTLGFVPLIFGDLYYFHTIVPRSIIAKSMIYSLTPLDTLADVLSRSLPGFPIINPVLKSILFILIIGILCWTAFRESVISKKDSFSAMLCVSGLLVIGIYTISHTHLFDWYIPLYTLPISIAYFSYSYLTEQPRNIIIRLPLLCLVLLSTISIITTICSAFYRPNAFVLFESGSRVKMYLVVGKIINEDYPSATLLTSEIGGLGYSFHGKIFDAVGLASSDALSFHPMKVPEQRMSGGFGAIPPEYVRVVSPDIIVSYDTFAEALLMDDISSQYNIIALPAYLPEDATYSESKTIWGSKYLRVYIRKSLPVSDKICALSTSTNGTPNDACT
jgi:hypothetical protein